MKENEYYAVIFCSRHSGMDQQQYRKVADRMNELARKEPGYLGVDSANNNENFGITISYWKNLESIQAWKNNLEHRDAQKKGKELWYTSYSLRVAKVVAEKFFPE